MLPSSCATLPFANRKVLIPVLMLCYLLILFSFRVNKVFHSDTDPAAAGAAAGAAAASDAATVATTIKIVVKTKAAAAEAAAPAAASVSE